FVCLFYVFSYGKGEGVPHCALTPVRASRIGIYSSFSPPSSMPINPNPSRLAATKVEPEPAKGSRTMPLGGVIKRTSHAIRSVGFTVGWLLRLYGVFPLSFSTAVLLPCITPARFSSNAISSPCQSLLRSFLLAFFDSSAGDTLGVTLARATLKYFE